MGIVKHIRKNATIIVIVSYAFFAALAALACCFSLYSRSLDIVDMSFHPPIFRALCLASVVKLLSLGKSSGQSLFTRSSRFCDLFEMLPLLAGPASLPESSFWTRSVVSSRHVGSRSHVSGRVAGLLGNSRQSLWWWRRYHSWQGRRRKWWWDSCKPLALQSRLDKTLLTSLRPGSA